MSWRVGAAKTPPDGWREKAEVYPLAARPLAVPGFASFMSVSAL